MDSDVSHIRTGVAGNVKAIKTGLPESPTPLFEWAVLGNGMLCTAQTPVGPDGAVVAGGIEEQARQVFEKQHGNKREFHSPVFSLARVRCAEKRSLIAGRLRGRPLQQNQNDATRTSWLTERTDRRTAVE
jgi:hypothetical protein